MLILNMVHCYNCNTSVPSLTRWDFNCCNCTVENQRVCTDGGIDYIKRCCNPGVSKYEDRSIVLGTEAMRANKFSCTVITKRGLELLKCLFASTFIKLSDTKLDLIELGILKDLNLIEVKKDKIKATSLLKQINKNGNYFAKIHL